MISRWAAPQIIVFGKFLAYKFRTYGFSVYSNQAAICLMRKNHGRQPCQQTREQQAANQHQYNRDCHSLSDAVQRMLCRFFHRYKHPFLKANHRQQRCNQQVNDFNAYERRDYTSKAIDQHITRKQLARRHRTIFNALHC